MTKRSIPAARCVDWNAMIDLDYDDQAALKGAGKFAMMNEAEVT